MLTISNDSFGGFGATGDEAGGGGGFGDFDLTTWDGAMSAIASGVGTLATIIAEARRAIDAGQAFGHQIMNIVREIRATFGENGPTPPAVLYYVGVAQRPTWPTGTNGSGGSRGSSEDTKESEGMSTGTKVALGAGVGVAGFFILKALL